VLEAETGSLGKRELKRKPRKYHPEKIKVFGQISGEKYKWTNIVAAKWGDAVMVPLEYEGAADCKLFEQ